MNHHCHGDLFTRWGKKWARCFYDSTMFEFQEGLEFCPHCKRPWEGIENAHDFKPDLSSEVLIQIDLPHFKFLAEERKKKIESLEELLEIWKKMYKDSTLPTKVEA